MRKLALALVLLLPACASDKEVAWPELSTLYRVEGGAVVCDEPAARADSSTVITCTWQNVTHEGERVCSAMVLFLRDDEAAPWRSVVLADPASCG